MVQQPSALLWATIVALVLILIVVRASLDGPSQMVHTER